MKLLTKSLMVLLASNILAGPSLMINAQESTDEQVINYVAPGEISSVDSTLIFDNNSANYVSQIQEGLYWTDSATKLYPAIAVDLPEISEDGLNYTINIREDVQWENGDPVTAHDFVYAIQRLVNPENAAQFSNRTESILNAPEIMRGESDLEELGVEALDDYTLEIKLSSPLTHFTSILASPSFYPLNQSFVEEHGDNFGTSSDYHLSNGPFVIENWDSTSQEWTLVKNENYYNSEEVSIDEVNVQVIKEVGTNVSLYEAGEVDNALLSGELARQYMDHPDVVQIMNSSTTNINFNHNREFFQNQNLRAAFDYAIDNDQLTEDVLGNGSQPLATFVPSNFTYNPETGEDFVDETGLEDNFDIETAIELWDEAKEELGIEELEVTLLSSDSESVKSVSEYIQGQLQNNLDGLTVSLQNVPINNRDELEAEGNYDMVITGRIADFPTPISFFDLMVTDGDMNRPRYSNSEYDEIVESIKTDLATEPAEQWEAYHEAHEILISEYAFIPLYQSVESQLRNPNIKDLVLRSVGPKFDFRNAYIEE